MPDGPGLDPPVLVGLIRLLRASGLAVPVGSSVMFAAAVSAVGGDRATGVYWAARATMCRRPEDVEQFDVCFRAWFAGLSTALEGPGDSVAAIIALDRAGPPDINGEAAAPTDPGEQPIVTVRFSRAEILAHRDFARYSEADHHEARTAFRDLRIAGARRRSRRLAPAHTGRQPDVRRTMRAAMRTEGEPLRRVYRAPQSKPRRLVVLCDVSGSMEPYARVIVRFLHAAVVARGEVEAFAMGTRLTRMTRELSNRDPDAAIAAAADRVTDWSGGTRLGETLRTFNDRWGVRGMARGAVVVIVSDGWDRGEPEVLSEQMQRLARVAHRVVWVNPLKASEGFAPLAAGMAVALPFVDDFVEGHSLASLADLIAVIDAQPVRKVRV